MMTALELLQDEKFRVATNFTSEDLSQPVPMKILNSVLCAYAKILASYCPYDEVSGPTITNYFSENFIDWFSQHFVILASVRSIARSMRNKTHGWFLTNLKREQAKRKRLGGEGTSRL